MIERLNQRNECSFASCIEQIRTHLLCQHSFSVINDTSIYSFGLNVPYDIVIYQTIHRRGNYGFVYVITKANFTLQSSTGSNC